MAGDARPAGAQAGVAPPLTELASLAASEEGGPELREEWFGIYQGEAKIGWAHRSIVPIPDGHRIRDESTLVLAMLGVPQRLTTSLSAEADETLALRRFDFTLVSPAATFNAANDFEGDPRPTGTGCDMGADEFVP